MSVSYRGTIEVLHLMAYLPRLQLGLLVVVLLDQAPQHLLQPLRVCRESRNDVVHRFFDENPVNHLETFPVSWERIEGLEHELYRQ